MAQFSFLRVAAAARVLSLAAHTVLIAALLRNRKRRRRAEDSLSDLNRRLMEAQEQERSRVARELHDDVCQQLTMLALELHRLNDTLPASEADVRRQVRDLHDAVRDLGQHVSELSHRLHSPKLDLFGLARASEVLCRDIASRHGVSIDFVQDNVPATLPEGIPLHLFRVLQEALSNAMKHSGASRCHVSLRGTGDQLQLEVSDDGRGFDTAAALATSGLGLGTMEERIRSIRGELAIDSRLESGTTIRATVSLRSSAAFS